MVCLSGLVERLRLCRVVGKYVEIGDVIGLSMEGVAFLHHSLNMRNHLGRNNVPGGQVVGSRTAVGYVRVSTDMQAVDGLSFGCTESRDQVLL